MMKPGTLTLVDPLRIIDRLRAYGANVTLQDGALRIVNRERIPPDAVAFIQKHRRAIADALNDGAEEAFDERAAIIEYDGKAPRAWAEQFARILIAGRPAGVDDLDWSWFITRCGQIIDEAPNRAAA